MKKIYDKTHTEKVRKQTAPLSETEVTESFLISIVDDIGVPPIYPLGFKVRKDDNEVDLFYLLSVDRGPSTTLGPAELKSDEYTGYEEKQIETPEWLYDESEKPEQTDHKENLREHVSGAKRGSD